MAILTPSASVLTIEIDQNAWENTDNKNEISASQDMSSYAILFEHDTQKTQVVTVQIFWIFVSKCYSLWELLYGCI